MKKIIPAFLSGVAAATIAVGGFSKAEATSTKLQTEYKFTDRKLAKEVETAFGRTGGAILVQGRKNILKVSNALADAGFHVEISVTDDLDFAYVTYNKN